MDTKLLEFVALLAYAISLGPVIAHAAAMGNKMKLDREEYLVAQKLYVGWQYFGLAELAAIVATLLLSIQLAGSNRFWFALVALLAITATLVVFLTRILPVNKRTRNWSQVPPEWQALRRRWERGHALNCLLTVVGLLALLFAVT